MFHEDQIYEQYFKDVSTARMPENAQEERSLFERYLNHGDLDARRRIVEGGLRFVIKMAKQYHRGDIDFLKNLIAAGNMGLIHAVDRYRPWVIKCHQCNTNNYLPTPKYQRCKNCKKRLKSQSAEHYTTRFLTYAAWWISEAIRTELYEASLVHIPPYKQKEHHRARQRGKNVGFTYVNYEDAVLQDITIETQHDDTDHKFMRNLLYDLLQTMKDRQAYVLIAYFGLREDPKTLREIAQKLGVCSERVRQIKEDALEELKQRLLRKSITSTKDLH